MMPSPPPIHQTRRVSVRAPPCLSLELQSSMFSVCTLFSRHRSYENLEPVPYAYNAGGVKAVQARARNATAPEVLAAHGGGGLFPLYISELAANGNYLEPEEIAVRKGVCRDPRLVRVFYTAPSPRCRRLGRGGVYSEW